MTPSFSRVKRARHASVARPRHVKIFREIPRASAATRAPASSGHSEVDATAAGVAAGRNGAVATVVIGEDVRDSNVAPEDRAMTAAFKAATPAPPGARN